MSFNWFSCSPCLITFFKYHLLFSWCCQAVQMYLLYSYKINAENNIAQCHITVCPFVTYPLFTFLLPCFWLGNRPRKFQSWYTCNYHISSLSLDLFHFWLSPFGTYIYAFACSQHEFIKLSMHSENMFTSLEKKCLYLFFCMTRPACLK